MNEISLIKKVQKGDTESFSWLVERYRAGLIIYCDQMIKDRQAAEDIAQDAFIKSYEKINDFDITKRYSTWLYTIARNKCMDYLRKNKQLNNDIEPDTLAYEPPELTFAQKQEVRDAVMALMPPEYRKVIEAYYWQAKSYQQIADEIDQPINTVRTWLRRGKKKLEEALL